MMDEQRIIIILFFLHTIQWLFIVETFKHTYDVFEFNALLIPSLPRPLFSS